MLLPVAMLVFAGLTMWEQFRMFTRNQEQAKITYRFYQTVIGVNAILALMTLIGQIGFLFPFLQDTQQSILALLLVQGVGILLAVWILSKLNRINKNVDKQYLRLKQYLAAQK